MENAKLNQLATTMMTDKVIQDKMGQQLSQLKEEQKQQKEDYELDPDFMDEETEKILLKMRSERVGNDNTTEKEREYQPKMKETVNLIAGSFVVYNILKGEYREITEEEFLPYVTKNEWTVCHFYHREFQRCKIIDMHLREIAKIHQETAFISLNVEKAPFFVGKLQIQTLPTICLFKKGIMVHKLVGFEEMGNKDDFKRITLIRALVKHGVMKPKNKQEKGTQVKRKGQNDSDSEDEDYD